MVSFMTKLANTKSVNRWYINSGVNYVRNTYGQIKSKLTLVGLLFPSSRGLSRRGKIVRDLC